jgi:hypothetical protein
MMSGFRDFFTIGLTVVGVALWFILGLAGCVMLVRKVGIGPGRKAFLIVFSIFLFPLGVATFFAGLLVPKMKECPYCRNPIASKASVCMYCGKEQPK